MVLKCKYCANERDSVHTLAAQFGRHWTQIWSSNPQLLSPDTLDFGQLLSLGNSYRLQNGDTWTSVAVRFGTSVSLLQQLNPDFSNPSNPGTPITFVDSAALYSRSIALNSTMCIMPETCAAYRPVVPGISW
jgi:spore germination protein YaaH